MENNIKGENKMESTALNFGSMDNFFDNMFSEESTPTIQNAPEQKELTEEEVKELGDNVENISNVDVQSVLNKLNNIESELNNEFVERSELIKIMLLSIVTNSNLLMLGPPGTAKTLISKAMCNRIDNSNFFEWLLNKSSDPSELLGTFSIKGMENDQFKRMTAGKLPEANIAFIDEVYKCNSPTLNALLSIMNEHIFFNDGKAIPVPLISMFAASNEPPEDESLLAMHDRFLFRMEVEYVHDASNKKRMFNNYIYDRAGINNSSVHTTITLEELKMLQEKAKSIPVPKAIINKFINLTNSLNKNSTIQISDRRANECFKVLQGSALLHGRSKVGLDDFNALKYVLWEKKEQIDVIGSEIAKIVNPFDEDFAKYQKQFNEVKGKIEGARDTKERNQTYFQYQNSLKNISGRMNKLISEASSNGKDVTEFTKLRDEIKNYNDKLIDEVLNVSNLTVEDTSRAMLSEDYDGDTSTPQAGTQAPVDYTF